MVTDPVTPRTARRSTWHGCDVFHLLDRPDLSVVEQVLAPGSAGEPHRHRRSRQFFYALEGTACLVVGRQELQVGAGAGVEVPPGVRHQVRNDGQQQVRLLVVSSPQVAEPGTAPRRGMGRGRRRVVEASLLRPTRPGDLTTVVGMEQAQDTRHFLGRGGTEWHRNALDDPDIEHWVLVDRLDRVVAFGVLAGLRRPGRVEIRRMVVAPEGRGQGLGRVLLRRLLEEALATPKVRLVWLDVSEDNTRARSLYRTMGFVEKPAPSDVTLLERGVYMEWSGEPHTLKR